MSQSWFCHGCPYVCDEWSSLVISFFIMLTLTSDTVFGSALTPLTVNMVQLTVTGAISPVIVKVYTNGSGYTYGCFKPFLYSIGYF